MKRLIQSSTVDLRERTPQLECRSLVSLCDNVGHDIVRQNREQERPKYPEGPLPAYREPTVATTASASKRKLARGPTNPERRTHLPRV